MTSGDVRASTSRVGRAVWIAAGVIASGIGFLGVIVPGLPTTVFFIVAAWAFSRSSPRLEAWVLNLPRIGKMVRDHRAGLGMPRRAKVIAISMIVVFAGGSVVFGITSTIARFVVIAAAAVGVAYITWRVPTRERVLATQ